MEKGIEGKDDGCVGMSDGTGCENGTSNTVDCRLPRLKAQAREGLHHI